MSEPSVIELREEHRAQYIPNKAVADERSRPDRMVFVDRVLYARYQEARRMGNTRESRELHTLLFYSGHNPDITQGGVVRVKHPLLQGMR